MNTAKDAVLRSEARRLQAGRMAVQRPKGRTRPGTIQARLGSLAQPGGGAEERDESHSLSGPCGTGDGQDSN